MPQPGTAPPKGRAAAIGGRSTDAALRTDDGVVRSDAPDARTAEGDVRRAEPARRPTPALPRPRTLPEPQASSTQPAAAIVVDPGNTMPAGPTELGVALPIADAGTGRLLGERDSGPLLTSNGLGVPRRWLVAIGALALVVGGLAAWIVFMPSGTSTTTTVASASTSNAATTPSASAAKLGEAPRAPGEPIAASKGAIDVKAIDGARIEVDGVEVGAAPMRVDLGVGTHEVKITAPGYAPWTQTVEVASGDNPIVEARLQSSETTSAPAIVPSTSPSKSGGRKKGKGVRAEDLPPPPSDDEEISDEDAPPDEPPLPDKPLPGPATPTVKKPPPPPPPPAPEPKSSPDPFLPTTKKEPTGDPLLPPG
jgi:PEGA domain-containing protein